MLKNTQSQVLQQKLSPQAIQAQLLLTIPTLALDQEIKKQLEDNPMLEDTKEETEAEAAAETAAKQEADNYTFENNYSYSGGSSSRDVSDRTEYLLDKGPRLRETPIEQLYKVGIETEGIVIGEEILGNLDDDGYLRINLDEIILAIKEKFGYDVSPDEVEKVLKIVQKLDPPGIAARNLQECLSIQLEEADISDEDRGLCLIMINDYFDEFSHKHFEKLSKLLNVSLEKINGLFEIIHRLNPVPGKQDSSADYIYPDFIINKIEGKFVVELNGDSRPMVRISKRYMEMLNSPDSDEKTKQFLKNRLDSAKWFINAVASRRETMLKVMNAILERQKDFFESRGSNLKPMYEKDIAEDINMDISTISRVVRGKYVQTDFGIFELKYFFSGALQTESGEDVSSKMVKEKIRGMIDEEDKSKPLSDDRIAEMLGDSGFAIARRTVAKYREAMRIPKATLRRQIVL